MLFKKRWINKETFLFKLVLLTLAIFLFQSILFRQTGETTEIRGQSLIVYPVTPEGVVEAFCKEDFMRGGNYWEMLQKYTVWEDSPGWDVTVLVTSYKVKKIKEDLNSALVRVEYKGIGEYSYDEIGPVFKKTQGEEVLIYELTKRDGIWKIESPQEPPHFDAQVVMQDLEIMATNEKDLIKLDRIRKVISELKAALVNLQ